MTGGSPAFLDRFRAIWRYRAFVVGSVSREIRLRYLGSVMGFFWVIAQPFALVAVYMLVFTKVLGARLDAPDLEASSFAYGAYLVAGLLPWMYFSETVTRNVTLFIDNATYLKNLAFPRSTLPIISLLTTSFGFALLYLVFLCLLSATWKLPGPRMLQVIPLLVVQQALAVAFGIILGAANVFFRDVGQFTAVVLQYWFWLTPIVYPVTIIPEVFRSALRFNPLFPLIDAHHRIVMGNELIDWQPVAPIAVASILLLLVAILLFRRLAPSIVDEL